MFTIATESEYPNSEVKETISQALESQANLAQLRCKQFQQLY